MKIRANSLSTSTAQTSAFTTGILFRSQLAATAWPGRARWAASGNGRAHRYGGGPNSNRCPFILSTRVSARDDTVGHAGGYGIWLTL